MIALSWLLAWHRGIARVIDVGVGSAVGNWYCAIDFGINAIRRFSIVRQQRGGWSIDRGGIVLVLAMSIMIIIIIIMIVFGGSHQ